MGSKFVDDIKAGGIVDREEGYELGHYVEVYRTFVRPFLEYCIQFCLPSYRKDSIKLERVQKRFTRMLPGMEGLCYKQRLNRLGLFSLELRRLKVDLIEVYKRMRGINKEKSSFRLEKNLKWEGKGPVIMAH
eukprot:g40260.t1